MTNLYHLVAMASIDPEMANKIQEIIHNEFHHATVLCISHRFRTVIDSDRMLVLGTYFYLMEIKGFITMLLNIHSTSI